MRTSTWLRAVTPLVVALSVLVLRPDAPLSAQTGSSEQTWYVSAVDRDGRPVDGLGPDAFVVRENGARREILRVSRADDPIDVTLLVDNSTAARDAITYLRKAIPPFINALTPANRVTLVGLADRPTMLVRSTTDGKALNAQAEALFALPSSGATLLDGLHELSEGLRSRDVPRAAFVAVVTDGPEFTNRYSKDVVESLKRAQVSLHLVTIGTFQHNDADHAIRERSFLLTAATKATGGALYTLLAPNGIAQNLEKIARDLTSQYKVVYARPDRTIPPDTIEITSARDNLVVRGTPARTKKGA